MNSNCSYSPEILNLGQNWRFSVLCDLAIWWMILTNDKAPLLCYTKLCKSFQSHRWIQTGVTVRKRSIMPKSAMSVPCDLEISRMTLKKNREPLLSYFKIWASFRSHLWIQTGVTVRKNPNLESKLISFLALWPWNLTDDLEKQQGAYSMLFQSLSIIS